MVQLRLLLRRALPTRAWVLAACMASGSVLIGGVAIATPDPQKDVPIDSVSTGAPAVLNLPQMGEPADAALSPAQEAEIGASVVGELYQYDYILDDAEITEYLVQVGWRLVAAAHEKPPRMDVFMVRDPRINAFALPGGHIGFNAGLVIASQTESELAGVMGHELTHVTQRHIARGQDAQSGLGTIATWAAVLGAIIIGSANPDVVLAALGIGQGLSYQRQVNFTRASELEADRIGIQTMADAGFDPEGMATFFQRLEQSSRLYGTGVPELLQTHPVNTTRISEARARAAAMKKTAPVTDSVEYQLIKARTRVLIAESPSDAVEAFSAELKSGRDNLPTRYGLALAYQQAGTIGSAIATLKPIFEANSKQINIALLMAQLKLSAGQPKEAIALLEKTRNLYPGSAPVILRYAAALIETGQPDQARQLLLSSEQGFGKRVDTYRLLSQAARESGDTGEASYEMANYLYYRGDYGGALAQLDAGLRIDSLSQQQRARMAARRAEVREALPRNYNPYAREPRQR